VQSTEWILLNIIAGLEKTNIQYTVLFSDNFKTIKKFLFSFNIIFLLTVDV
jgi:hypothetical protein